MPNRYPERIMRTLRERKGLEPSDTICDDEINLMSPNEAFEEILEWNGICNYAYTIKHWIEDIYGIDLDAMG